MDRFTTWSVVILAVGMAVGYQLLPRMDALLSVTRWRGRWPRPRPT